MSDSSSDSNASETEAVETQSVAAVPAGKKKRRCVSYQAVWEENPVLKDWLTKSKRADGKAFCKICQKDLEFGNGGAYDLERHGKSVAHQKRAKSTKTQPSLSATVSQASAMSQAVTDAVMP